MILYEYESDEFKEAFREVKELIKAMNGLSEEGFTNRYLNDPAFNTGVDLITRVFMKVVDKR